MKKMEWKKNVKQCLTAVISGMFLCVFCGCAKEEMPETEPDSPMEQYSMEKYSMGYYVETEITLPDSNRSHIEQRMVQLADGRIEVNDRLENGWLKKISVDDGKTFETLWESLDAWQDGERREVDCYNRVFVSTGESMALVRDADQRTAECSYITPEGETRFFSIEYPPEEEGLGEMLWSGGDNQFYITLGQGVYRILPEEERIEFLFRTGQSFEYIEYLNVCGDYLYGISSQNLFMYQLSTEELVEKDEVLDNFLKNHRREMTVSGEFTCLFDDDGRSERIYVVTADGIYAHVPYGNTMELVVDGEICKMGDDRLHFVNFEVLGEGQTPIFLVLFNDNTLFRYEFDPDAVLLAERTLRVFSMYESEALKVAATEFRKKYPKIRVRYEVGMTGEDGVTENDVMRNLSLELAAGKGPDVILMDGLPLDAYEEKDILLDLSGLLAGLDGTNMPLEQVAHTYERDGKVYCIPATWSFAILIGEKSYLENMDSLEQLADAVEEMSGQGTKSNILAFSTAKEALEILSLGSYGSFMKEDGELDKAAVADFLYQSKRIYEVQRASLSEMPQISRESMGTAYSGIMGKRTVTDNVEVDALNQWKNGYEFAAGWVTGSLKDCSYWLSVADSMENGTFIRMPGARAHGYSADNLLTINRGAQNPEDAKTFVTYMLSYEFQREQRENLGGIPVNDKACFSWVDELLPRTSSMEIYQEDRGDYTRLDFEWPDRTQVAELREMALENEGAQNCSAIVYDKVIEIGQQVLLGDCSVEDAVERIEEDVRLYLAE